MGAAKKAGLAATIEGMGAVAVADMEAIKAAEDLAAEAQKKLNALQQKAAKEKADLAAELKKTKAELTAEKEAATAAGKGDVLLIMDDIAKLDKVGTALLRDKKEMLASIGHLGRKKFLLDRLCATIDIV